MVDAMQVKVYSNSDDTLLAWKVDRPIPDCRGFAIYRKVDGRPAAEILANRVGWDEDDAKREAPSTEWPIQRFTWTDYKARSGEVVSYRIVPMVGPRDHLKPKEDEASAWTKEITIRPDGSNGVTAFFNRGIVASQWLSRVIGPGSSGTRQRKLRDIINDPDDRTRKFLGGEVRAALLRILERARKDKVDVYAALYELDDPELIDALVALGKRAHVVLANGSTKKKADDPNEDARAALNKAKVEVHDRLTAPRHLAHNKFLVITDHDGTPQQVWTGSTNWSKTGLCTQANNALVLTNRAVAGFFKKQWEQLRDAESTYDRAALAEINTKSRPFKDGARSFRVWFTPVTEEADLDEVRDLIAKAKDGILFLMFNPGPAGTLLNAIIDRKDDPGLIVQGVVNQDPSTTKNPVLIFRRKQVLKGSFQVALPAAIDKRVSYWIPELKKLQGAWAMVHSKVIVIDPFSADPVVVTGSHNLGPKASKGNDDNLVIIRGDRELAAAYAVNIAGIYTSYRWRWNRIYSEHARAFTHLDDDDTWQRSHLSGDRLQELDFWMGA
jgi:phosphatidylserine/phosphatidylglycerophosphate/cardiolipin synthase-like enzyme